MEADLIPQDAPERADLLTGTLGELSPFHATFGYYGDGVSFETATLPQGWRDRLVAIDNPNTNGYVGLCLEVHDLLISKYVAGREKDREFCIAIARAGLVSRAILHERLNTTELDEAARLRILATIDADLPD